MSRPLIGSLWNLPPEFAPERTTLAEARKRYAGRQLWATVTSFFRRAQNA